jgi:hypothetical protein
MSTLIPNCSLTEFKKLRAEELRRLKSCEVFADGEYLFTFINPASDYIRVQAEGLGVKGNAVGGEDLQGITKRDGIATSLLSSQ